MSPTLSRSSALQRVKVGDALEIRNGIIFDFYSGLPHIYIYISNVVISTFGTVAITPYEHLGVWLGSV